MTLHTRALGGVRGRSAARRAERRPPYSFFVREAPRHDAALREVARRVVGAFYIYHDVPEEDRAARQLRKFFRSARCFSKRT